MKTSSLPKIVICGRPNVGKSSLFNRICKKRVSIVADEEGVTRDVIMEKASFFEKSFYLLDTGGIEGRGIDFQKELEDKAKEVIDLADLIIMVVDGQVGPQLQDLTIAKKLHQSGKKIILAVNKTESIPPEKLHDFKSLGVDAVVPISCSQGEGVEDLLGEALSYFPDFDESQEDTKAGIAIIGRPNVGKSTLMNQLLGSERSIASPIAGTTRDAVSEDFSDEGIILIDTAGLRRKKSEKSVIEKFAAMRTKEAIENAKLCLIVVDMEDGFTTEDAKIVHMAEKEGKGIIVLCNKWDEVKDVRMEHMQKALLYKFPMLAHYPFLFISAKTGRNIDKIKQLMRQTLEELSKKIPTPQLNDVVHRAVTKYQPARIMGKRLKVFYAVQVGTMPPRFALFVNRPDLMMRSYQKYLIHALREAFSFQGAPIFLHLKGKKV
jgi:GTPase